MVLIQKLKNTDYIYLLREREFIKTGECVYKIGKTTQFPERRFGGYPKGSEIHVVLKVNNCTTYENHLKQLFDVKFKNRPDIGREYYEGNVDLMVGEFFSLKSYDVSMSNKQDTCLLYTSDAADE